MTELTPEQKSEITLTESEDEQLLVSTTYTQKSAVSSGTGVYVKNSPLLPSCQM